MSDYAEFAPYYDRFTGDVDYPARARYFDTVIQKYAPGAALLLDLACGTGSLSFELERLGYDVIGVDGSYEMLGEATQKRAELESEVLFLCQEMDELDLYGTVDATVCALDSLNHITEETELKRVFSKVSLFSNPGAIFVFDVNTEYKHRELLGCNNFVFDEGDTLCIWQNDYEPESGIVDISLDFFERAGETGLWKRSSADFSERTYPNDRITELLKAAGFELKAIFDEDSFLPLRADSSRAIFVAKKI